MVSTSNIVAGVTTRSQTAKQKSTSSDLQQDKQPSILGPKPAPSPSVYAYNKNWHQYQGQKETLIRNGRGQGTKALPLFFLDPGFTVFFEGYDTNALDRDKFEDVSLEQKSWAMEAAQTAVQLCTEIPVETFQNHEAKLQFILPILMKLFPGSIRAKDKKTKSSLAEDNKPYEWVLSAKVDNGTAKGYTDISIFHKATKRLVVIYELKNEEGDGGDPNMQLQRTYQIAAAEDSELCEKTGMPVFLIASSGSYDFSFSFFYKKLLIELICSLGTLLTVGGAFCDSGHQNPVAGTIASFHLTSNDFILDNVQNFLFALRCSVETIV